MKKYGLNADKLADTRVTGYRRNVLHPLLIGTVCALVGAWPVHAEDLVERGPPADAAIAPIPAWSDWSGLYGGIHGGGGAFTGTAMDWDNGVFGHPEDFSQRQNTSFQAEGDFDLNGFAKLVGGQVGYNHQTGHVIWGLEGDMAWTGFNEGRVFKRGDNYVKAQMDWLATLRGRLGLATGNGMAYVTGGLAMARVGHCANKYEDGKDTTGIDYELSPCSNEDVGNTGQQNVIENIAWDGVQPGLVAGVGVEARISEHLSLKGEYLYLHLANKNLVYNSTNDADIDFGHNAHLFRLGLNVHLNPMALDGQDSVGLNGWNGFYAGIHGGVGAFTGTAMDWDRDTFSNPDGDINLNGFAGLAGGQVGYNHQIGHVVWGLEGDMAWTGFSEGREFDLRDNYVKAQMDWLATLRGRLGVASGNGMAYVTGGLALAQLSSLWWFNDGADPDPPVPCSIDDDENIAWNGVQPGLVAGAGVEARLSERLSLKGEYLCLRMADKNVVYDNTADGNGADQDIDFGHSAHLFRLGLNAHLNPMALEGEDSVGLNAWNGFYAGLHGGGGAFTGTAMDWDTGVFDGPDGDIDVNGFAGLAGGQVGYNYQTGHVVWGLEGDMAWTGFSEGRTFKMRTYFKDGLSDNYVKAQMDWLATLRGRLGVATGNGMAYVTGGLALARVRHCANDYWSHRANFRLDPCSSELVENIAWDGVQPGLVAGAGAEARISERLSLKGEYLYLHMADKNVVYIPANNKNIDFGNNAHLIRVGLNFAFN